MKILHTADWHLGKLVQGVYMTEDQRIVLEQLLSVIEAESPDVVIIAGDLYDRAVPPTEAVQLLDELLEKIVLHLQVPVLAIAGNHDSPARLDFGNRMMRASGLHMAGELVLPVQTARLHDEFGPVDFHLVPYTEPGIVRYLTGDESVRTHQDAMRAITESIRKELDPAVRHVLVGHAFVTPGGEAEPNTSDSERPLTIGGAEHVSAANFAGFHYTALGHLHQSHFVGREQVQYAGSPLKYSISEEHHKKGFLMVELDAEGKVSVEKRELLPRRDMRVVEGFIADLERHPVNDDYVFVRLLDQAAVTSPMERIRAVYPNAMHVERRPALEQLSGTRESGGAAAGRAKMDGLSLFKAFYEDVTGNPPSGDTEGLFIETLREIALEEGERYEADQADDDGIRAV